MTIEQLLQPRYKVLTGYPGCFAEEGSIITFKSDCATITPLEGEEHPYIKAGESKSIQRLYFDRIEQYPKVFQKMEWWEERSISDLSEVKYLKYPTGSRVFDVVNWKDYPNHLLQPLFEYHNRVGAITSGCAVDLEISTEEEYKHWLSSQVQDKWWIGKELCEMPEYIKLVDKDQILKVWKIKMWQMVENAPVGWPKNGIGIIKLDENTLVATHSEYLQFINE